MPTINGVHTLPKETLISNRDGMKFTHDISKKSNDRVYRKWKYNVRSNLVIVHLVQRIESGKYFILSSKLLTRIISFNDAEN